MYGECQGVAPRGIGLRVVRVMVVLRLFEMDVPVAMVA